MNYSPNRVSIIGAIVRKDLTELSRDRLFLVLSLGGVLFFVLLFWLLPATVNETITVGIHQPGLGALLDQAVDTGTEGVRFQQYAQARNCKQPWVSGRTRGRSIWLSTFPPTS